MENVLSSLFLPIFILFMLGSIAGVKSEAMAKICSDIFIGVIRGVAVIAGSLIRVVLEGIQIHSMNRALSQKQDLPKRQPAPTRVKVTVVEED